MKLLLTNFHEGDGGGHTTYVMTLARHLAARHEVHVAAPPGSRLYRQASALEGVHALAQPFPNGLKHLAAVSGARRALAAYLREHRFDVVHVNGSADHRLVLSALLGLNPQPKIVFTKHNSKAVDGLGHWWRARRTDLAIGVSEATRRMLDDSAYARCERATVRNGIDLEHYWPWPADAAAAARRRYAGDAELLLGSNAGTAEHKGWMDLAEALASLPDDHRQRVRVLLCGKPPSTAQRERLRELHLEDRIVFAGMLEDVRPAIAAFDAGFVLSYAVETISFACREMMAMGKPVLVSDYAGLPENIDPGIDGWVVPVRDRAAIANAIIAMLDAPERLTVMGHAAREKAEREFGLPLFVERTEQAYLALLRGAAT